MNAKKKPSLPKSVDWPDATREWFKVWCDSPHTDSWDDSQWQYMFDTALVHAEVWGSYNTSMMGELRARESYMGLAFDQKPTKQKPIEVSVIQAAVNDRKKKAKRAKA